MADIMNTNWDEPMNEVTFKQAVGAGVVGGLIAGGYKGVKNYRLDKLDREERDDEVQRILDAMAERRRKRRQYKDTATEKRREVKLAAYEKAKRKLDESTASRKAEIIDDPTRAALKKLKATGDLAAKADDAQALANQKATAIDGVRPEDTKVSANLPKAMAESSSDERSALKPIGLGLGAYGAYKLTKAITAAGTKRALEDAEIARAEHERAFPKKEKSDKSNKNESVTVLSKVW